MIPVEDTQGPRTSTDKNVEIFHNFNLTWLNNFPNTIYYNSHYTIQAPVVTQMTRATIFAVFGQWQAKVTKWKRKKSLKVGLTCHRTDERVRSSFGLSVYLGRVSCCISQVQVPVSDRYFLSVRITLIYMRSLS